MSMVAVVGSAGARFVEFNAPFDDVFGVMCRHPSHAKNRSKEG